MCLAEIRKYLWQLIVDDKIPVWLTLLLMILGALGAYWLAPVVNEKFELQVAKREFLVSSMKDFAKDSKSFIDAVGNFVNDPSPDKASRISLVSKAAELNFFAVQLTYVIPEDKLLLLDFQNSINKVQRTVGIKFDDTNQSVILGDLKIMSQNSLLIYKSLAEKAGLGE